MIVIFFLQEGTQVTSEIYFLKVIAIKALIIKYYLLVHLSIFLLKKKRTGKSLLYARHDTEA